MGVTAGEDGGSQGGLAGLAGTRQIWAADDDNAISSDNKTA